MSLIVKILILTIGLFSVGLFSGCTTTKLINQRYPIIPIPNRPIISNEFNKNDFSSIIKYSKKLEVSIKLYNTYANEQNIKIEQHFAENAK